MSDWTGQSDSSGECRAFVSVSATGMLSDLDLYLEAEEQCRDETGDFLDDPVWQWRVSMSEEDSSFGDGLIDSGIATTKAAAMAAATESAREALEADGYPTESIERALPKP